MVKKLNLAEIHPELAAQWHPIKNGSLTPNNTFVSKRVWWKCPVAEDHEWQVRICDRIKGPSCPYCIFYRLSKTNSLRILHPQLAKRWHPSKNGLLTPETVIGTGQHKKYWWRCNDGHEWQASIFSHIRKDETYRECPQCKATPLAITHPDIASQWHPIKNGALQPTDVRAGSPTYIWWKCSKGPDHEWPQKLVERTRGGTGCPFCDGKKISVTNSLAVRYPELAKQWHLAKNNNVSPDHVFGGGKKKYWWQCQINSNHVWDACIEKRANGQDCPICKNLKVDQSNCLSLTHPEIAKEWHQIKNGTLTSDYVVAGSGKRIWWQCSSDNTHEWQATCNDRTGSLSGCPFCVDLFNSHGVQRIVAWLRAHGISFEREKTFSDLKSVCGKYSLRFDFFLKDLKIFIEFDGQQHFKPIKAWGGDKAFQKLIENDKRKALWATQNGYNLVRIKFSDSAIYNEPQNSDH